MTEKYEEIGAYEARIHWGRMLDEVQSQGKSYVVSKHREPVAALVPLAALRQYGQENAEAAELARLVEEVEVRHAETQAHLDKAFAQLAAMRRALAEAKAERAEERQKGAGRAGSA